MRDHRAHDKSLVVFGDDGRHVGAESLAKGPLVDDCRVAVVEIGVERLKEARDDEGLDGEPSAIQVRSAE